MKNLILSFFIIQNLKNYYPTFDVNKLLEIKYKYYKF